MTTKTKTKTVDRTVELHAAGKQLINLKRQMRALEVKRKYRPNDEDLSIEIDAVIDAITDQEMAVEALQELISEEKEALAREQASKERERLTERSRGYTFTVPDDDAILGCQMLAAIAQQLQYEFCRTQGPYEALNARIYNRRAGEEDGAGANTGTHADPNYELNRSDVDKLDQLAARRDYVQTLRFSVATHFEAMKEKIDPDASFIPTMLRQTDAQRFEDLEKRSYERFTQQLDERRKAGEAARSFTRNELSLF